MQTFTLFSKELGGQFTREYFYNGLGVNGDNVSPDLGWINPPPETKSFALTIYDPATQTGSGWWHWVLFNIPAGVRELPKGAGSVYPGLMPVGAVSSVNDFGKTGYGGPVTIPGSGFHPYEITLHALSDLLQLDEHASPAMVGFSLNQIVVAKASIMAWLKV